MTKEQLEARLLELAHPIDRHVNGGDAERREVGFLLCAFEFGEPGGTLAFLSNAQPDTLIAALRELIVKLESTGRVVNLPRGGRG